MEKEKLDAFLEVCKWFKEYDEPVCAQQLVTKMKDFLPVDSEHHMLQKLNEIFFGNIIVFSKYGLPNMGETVTDIILDYQKKTLKQRNII